MSNERQTLVMEFTCMEPIGTDDAGVIKTKNYLRELAEIVGLQCSREPVTHLSPQYGLSGWLPLAESSAIHLYAWDDRSPSFVSVDISTGRQLSIGRLVEHVESFFNVDGTAVAVKSTNEAHECRWWELDGAIHRQRLSIRAKNSLPMTRQAVRNYLIALCETLSMVALSEPIIEGQTAWMHWETSGVIMYWAQGIEVDIYTCKPFNTVDAIELTREMLQASSIVSRCY